jgi:hypothetical protein
MQSGSNRKPAIRVSLWKNEYAQGERDPFAKGKLSIPLDCLSELLHEWAAGTLPVDSQGNAQLNVSAWTKDGNAHEKAPDLSGQATSPAELRDYYQRSGKDMPQTSYAQPLVPWDLPKSVQALIGQGAGGQESAAPVPAAAPVYQQQAAAAATTARPLF